MWLEDVIMGMKDMGRLRKITFNGVEYIWRRNEDAPSCFQCDLQDVCETLRKPNGNLMTLCSKLIGAYSFFKRKTEEDGQWGKIN